METFQGWTDNGTATMIAPAKTATGLGYDGAETGNRRKTAPVDKGSEDRVLDRNKRRRLLSNTRDLRRNFALAVWIIRKHLDYVASFTFQANTPNQAFNKEIEKIMKRFSRPKVCDVSGRFSLRKMIRLIEAKSVVDGDCGLMKVARRRFGRSLYQLQGIEGDRVKDPEDPDEYKGFKWEQGILIDDAHRHYGYSIHKRTRAGRTEPERIIPARSMIWHNGYVENFDQTRGISPLAPALNPMRDLYENFDYALARMKISQLFAFAITRSLNAIEEEADMAYGAAKNAATGQAFEDEDPAETDDTGNQYDIDFGKGNVILDMDPGHDAKFLESNQPSDQFQSFTLSMIQLTLKALDIPYSFYSENFTNFFGSRGALQHYERSCRDRRETLQEILREITIFVLVGKVLDGSLVLPKGWTIADIDHASEWVPDGIPWWDPAKEIRGDLMAIGAGLDTPQRICKERGRGDFQDNLDQIATAIEAARAKGVKLSFDPGDDPEDDKPDNETADDNDSGDDQPTKKKKGGKDA